MRPHEKYIDAVKVVLSPLDPCTHLTLCIRDSKGISELSFNTADFIMSCVRGSSDIPLLSPTLCMYLEPRSDVTWV